MVFFVLVADYKILNFAMSLDTRPSSMEDTKLLGSSFTLNIYAYSMLDQHLLLHHFASVTTSLDPARPFVLSFVVV